MPSFDRHDPYDEAALDVDTVDRDPIAQFAAWLSDAERAALPDPNAMVVSTVDPDGTPSSRTVLLKSLDGGRFTFYTNRASHKGLALAHETRVALLFPWYALHRQVRVVGRATLTDDSVSDAYWAGRPRESQLGAWASTQSAPIASRDELDAQYAATTAQFDGVDAIPRPEHWGGYDVTPASIELWSGRRGRLHDRLLYTRSGGGAGGGWDLTRLQP